MQGPFSEQMNRTMIEEFQIQYLVTKESGATGGFIQKREAAKKTGCKLVVIERPQKEEGISLEELMKQLGGEDERIAIVGVGMGNWKTLTVEAKERIQQAQLLIGAKRLIEPFSHASTVISYRPEEIRAVVEQTDKEEIRNRNVGRYWILQWDEKTAAIFRGMGS